MENILDFANVSLQLLSLHKVGNKSKGEEIFLSQELYEPSDEQRQELLSYFLVPFKAITTVYKFHHSTDISYNEVNGYCSKIFNRKDTFLNRSIDIVKHLYDQSEHPNIKSGEVFVGYFTGVLYNGEIVNAVGIFKSERKESFFQFKKHSDNITIQTFKGVHAKKLDKGCLILDTEKEEGLRVFTVDNNSYDAEYWIQKFLDIEDARDYNYQTRNYINLCKDFSSEIIEPTGGKKEGISFLNHSIKYLSDNETLDFDDFTHSVFDSEELKKKFKNYRKEFENNRDVEIADEFEISKPTLRLQKKRLKSQITLDTQIQIKIGLNNGEVDDKFIEKGYDDKKRMFFYKIYFNQETD